MRLTSSLVRRAGEVTIPGSFLRAFIHNGQQYYVSEIGIYKDGMIDCWGLVSLDEFKGKVQSGEIVTRLPEGASVSISVGISLIATHVQSYVEEDEFVKEVEDVIRELNGEKSSIQVCRDMLQAYKDQPSEEGKRRLGAAYEAIPKHRRMLLDGMSAKDDEVRTLLGI